MKISIVIPNWNGKNLIEKNFSSWQNLGADELIIVDDGSTDGSVALLKNLKTKELKNKSFQLIENKKNLGYFILIIMLISSIFLIYDKSINTKSLINDNELDVITKFQNTEENAFVMTTSSLYSPWLIGYSNRKTIAPGLFDYNLHNREQWDNFWKTTDINYIKEFMNAYKKPLYIFIGEKQVDNLKSYQDCFITYYQNADNKIYQYMKAYEY